MGNTNERSRTGDGGTDTFARPPLNGETDTPRAVDPEQSDRDSLPEHSVEGLMSGQSVTTERIAEVTDRILRLRELVQGYHTKPINVTMTSSCFTDEIITCMEFFWTYQELQYDFTSHTSVPPHWERKKLWDWEGSHLMQQKVIPRLERAAWHPKTQYDDNLVSEFDDT